MKKVDIRLLKFEIQEFYCWRKKEIPLMVYGFQVMEPNNYPLNWKNKIFQVKNLNTLKTN